MLGYAFRPERAQKGRYGANNGIPANLPESETEVCLRIGNERQTHTLHNLVIALACPYRVVGELPVENVHHLPDVLGRNGRIEGIVNLRLFRLVSCESSLIPQNLPFWINLLYPRKWQNVKRFPSRVRELTSVDVS